MLISCQFSSNEKISIFAKTEKEKNKKKKKMMFNVSHASLQAMRKFHSVTIKKMMSDINLMHVFKQWENLYFCLDEKEHKGKREKKWCVILVSCQCKKREREKGKRKEHNNKKWCQRKSSISG